MPTATKNCSSSLDYCRYRHCCSVLYCSNRCRTGICIVVRRWTVRGTVPEKKLILRMISHRHKNKYSKIRKTKTGTMVNVTKAVPTVSPLHVLRGLYRLLKTPHLSKELVKKAAERGVNAASHYRKGAMHQPRIL